MTGDETSPETDPAHESAESDETPESPATAGAAEESTGAAPADAPPRDRTRTRPKRRFLQRTTPRRWLPFLILLAIVAAVIVIVEDEGPEQLTQPVTAPGELIPVAAPDDALSTAFFCPGGSALGSDGIAELALVLANSRATASRAEIDLVALDGTVEHLALDVPAYGMARVLAADHLEADWVSATVDLLGGGVSVQQQVVGRGVGSDLAPCPTSTSAEWFAPAGSTAIGAEEHLLVYNPFPAPAIVSFEFVSGGSSTSPRSLQSVTIPGSSLRVFTGDDLPSRRDQVAVHLTTRTGQVVLGRVQSFDGEGQDIEEVRGAPEIPAPEGVAATPALPVTSTRWVFPTATNDPEVRNAVTIHNPNEETAEINLLLSYENRGLNAEIEPIQVTVRGGEVQTVDLRDRPGLDDGAPYTIFLDSFSAGGSPAVPVVAELEIVNAVRVERPVVEDDGEADEDDHDHEHTEVDPEDGTGDEPSDEGPERFEVKGYAAVAGSPVAAGSWIVPEVNTAGPGSVSVVVFNPASRPVEVSVETVVGGRREPLTDLELGPGDRTEIDLGDLESHLSLLISADGGVVVGQSVTGEKRGVSGTIASPVPGTVRTLPPPMTG